MPRPRSGAARAGAPPAGLADPLGLAGRLATARELDDLERGMLALAVHPEGTGFRSATWFALDPARERLTARRRAAAEPRPAALAAVLEQALRLRPAGSDDLAPHDIALDPGALTGALEKAWRRGHAAGAGAKGTPWAGSAAIGALRIELEGEPQALIVGEWEAEHAPADASPALESLAALGSAALGMRLQAARARRGARSLAALARIARAAVSTLNLAEALRIAVESCVAACEARGAAIWLRHGKALRLEATHGFAVERDRVAASLAAVAESAAGGSAAFVIDPGLDDPRFAAESAMTLSVVVAAPLAAYGEPLGALAVWFGSGSGAPERDSAALVEALADTVAVCVDQARRFEQLRTGRQRERETDARLRRAERLAALGEVARRAGTEARNPLASIGAFARRMQRALEAGDPNREYLEIIVRESERLERLLGEQSEYLTPEAPRLRVESLNAVVQETLSQSAETLVRRRIRLLKRLAPELPALLLDAARMRRVLANVLESALDGTPVGGRIRVETRHAAGHALVEIAHDGPREAGEILEQLFVPFASSRAGGPAVGLGVAQQVVREHGGEIRIRSDSEWSVVVTLTLPIPENRDRRRPGADRRFARPDRRAGRQPQEA